MSLPKRNWADMAWPDFREAANWIAVAPVAAIEQHGPHLPLSTDAEIMQGYRSRVIAALPKSLPATFLPLQTVGLSPEHRDFPGTLTLSPETALKAWTELGDSVARTGGRKLGFLSSHGGNNGLLEIVARELRSRHTMLAVVASFPRFGYPEGLFSEDEITHGIHGGEIETSLMMAFKPDMVRMDKLVHFKSETLRMQKEFKHLRAAKPAGFGWLTQDLHPNGGLGNAKNADPDKGRAAADFGAKAFVELLHDVEAFPLERLKKGPLG